jgi:hypothetical protein
MALVPPEALWDRADLLANLVANEQAHGRLADANALMPELERAVERTGHPAEVLVRMVPVGDRLLRTGNLRAFMAAADQASGLPSLLTLWVRAAAAVALIRLGQIDEGLARLALLAPHQYPRMKGSVEAQMLVAHAMAGRRDDARAAWSSVSPRLPEIGRRNSSGAWPTLSGAVVGLSLLGDTEGCGALHQAANAWAESGQVLCPELPIEGPQLVAGIAAHAAGLCEPARDHFETALRHARDVPIRLQQATTLFSYGRMLLDDPNASERARGRAMVEAAGADFRTLEMVTYGTLAETVLRSSDS